jgi:hypothetical protein
VCERFTWRKKLTVKDSAHLHVDSSLVHELQSGETYANFRSTTFYINQSHEDLCVIHRNNLPAVIPKSGNLYIGEQVFVVRTLYHFHGRNNIIDAINNLKVMKDASKMPNKDIELLYSSLLKAFDNNRNLTYHYVGIDKKIPIKEIKDNTAVYIDEADVLVCQIKSMQNLTHPYSQEGIASGAPRRFANENKISGVFIEIVDNDSQIESRYVYMAKDVVEIPARRDRSRKSGVYVIKASCDDFDTVKTNASFHTLKEAQDTVGLYPTRDEATTFGNPELLLKAEQDKLRSKNLQQEAELEELRRTNLKLKEESEAARLVRTDEADTRKLQRQDFYETRSYERKDNSEAMKTIGTIAVTAVTVAALLLNNGRSSKK